MFLAAIIGGMVGVLVTTEAVRGLLGNRTSDASVDKVLVQTASEINKNLPMMVDRVTRLDATVAVPGKKLYYRYTLVGIEPTEDEIISGLRQTAVNNYKTAAEMAGLRKMNVTLVYGYSDEAGNQLGRFEISPDDFD